jgi:hypothetical protein
MTPEELGGVGEMGVRRKLLRARRSDVLNPPFFVSAEP